MRKFVGHSYVTARNEKPAERERPPYIPESGYNVVSIDRDKPPGVDMFVLGHYETEAEADAARLRFEAEGVECGVWGAFKDTKKKAKKKSEDIA